MKSFTLSDELLDLSAPQPDFKYNVDIFSNCLLLHQMLITGQGEQVVRMKARLNEDLLKHTCEEGDCSRVRSG